MKKEINYLHINTHTHNIMFTKKSNIDIKKSTLKLQDGKKDSASRLRHLKTILGKNK